MREMGHPSMDLPRTRSAKFNGDFSPSFLGLARDFVSRNYEQSTHHLRTFLRTLSPILGA